MVERQAASEIGPDEYPVFRAMTRPQLLWGVPYELAVLNVLAFIVGFMLVRHLLVPLGVFPMHAVMYLAAQREPRFFEILRVSLRFVMNPARARWGSKTLAP